MNTIYDKEDKNFTDSFTKMNGIIKRRDNQLNIIFGGEYNGDSLYSKPQKNDDDKIVARSNPIYSYDDRGGGESWLTSWKLEEFYMQIHSKK